MSRLARAAVLGACCAVVGGAGPDERLAGCLGQAGGAAGRAADVFIGGVSGLARLLAPGAVAPMLATGRVGLYLHAAVPGAGLQALSAAQRDALLRAWGRSGVLADGGGYGVGEIGCVTQGQDAENDGYWHRFGAAGRLPVMVNINCSPDGSGTGRYTATADDKRPGTSYPGYVTAADLVQWQSAVREAARRGAQNVAVFSTPNNLARDLEDPFATAPFYANDRAVALYAGGIALDVPADFYIHNPSPLYQSKVVEMVRWGVANGLRVSLVVSPWAWAADAAGHDGADGTDPLMTEHVGQLLAMLRQAGALPTQWVVENYSAAGTPNQPVGPNAATSLAGGVLVLAQPGTVAAPGRAVPGFGGMAEARVQQLAPCLASR